MGGCYPLQASRRGRPKPILEDGSCSSLAVGKQIARLRQTLELFFLFGYPLGRSLLVGGAGKGCRLLDQFAISQISEDTRLAI